MGVPNHRSFIGSTAASYSLNSLLMFQQTRSNTHTIALDHGGCVGRWESGKKRCSKTEWAREQHPYPPTTSRPSAEGGAVLAPTVVGTAGAGGAGEEEAGGEAGAAALLPSAKEGTAAVVGADRLPIL